MRRAERAAEVAAERVAVEARRVEREARRVLEVQLAETRRVAAVRRAERAVEVAAEAEARRVVVEARRVEREAATEARRVGCAAINSTVAIFNGEHAVERSDIGRRTHVCPHCSAILYPGEKDWTMMCCREGKVCLPLWTLGEEGSAPRRIHDAWMAQDTKGKTLRKYARPINNALALASQVVNIKTPPGGGYTPSVVIQGKLYHNMGPLRPDDGAQPIFAQVYVLDDEYTTSEIDIRVMNCRVPGGATQAERASIRELLEEVQGLLRQCNPYVQDFVSLAALPAAEVENKTFVLNALARPSAEHARRYNKPEGLKEVCVLIDDAGGRATGRDMVVDIAQGGGVKRISDCHQCFDPLHYTTIFPTGEHGWDYTLKLAGDSNLTPRDFTAFHLHQRPSTAQRESLFYGSRLFQEYLCMSYAKVETQRLEYLRFHQKEIRADLYVNVVNHLGAPAAAEARRQERVESGARAEPRDASQLGSPSILPASFPGSPRDMQRRYQDAMAIVRCYGKPDLFVTVTCNPLWPEIQEELLPGQKAEDRPDLTARVFKQVFDKIMHDITKNNIFGELAAEVAVIEFQKRGLPHAHILLILKEKILTADQVDKFVCAELPKDNPELRTIVTSQMYHRCKKDLCIKEGCPCSKGFPKAFSSVTQWNEEDTHPTYGRRSPAAGGYSGEDDKGRPVDNSRVVPYNPYLTLKYNAHINVEVCSSTRACKYLFKYIHKGGDRAMMVVAGDEGSASSARDELKEYQDVRSIGASEAGWRLYAFAMSRRSPNVVALQCHLENGTRVSWGDADEAARIAAGPPPVTHLTAWLKLNAETPPGTDPPPVYHDMPATYTWVKGTKGGERRGVPVPPVDPRWKKKTRNTGDTVGRVHWVHPGSGDVFYLRMLLTREESRGKGSFAALREVHGEEMESYKAACAALGLLQDDNEWDGMMTEATATQMPKAMRKLFLYVVLNCAPSQTVALFDKHAAAMSEDFVRDVERIQGAAAAGEMARPMLLLDLEQLLFRHNPEWTLESKGFPTPSVEERAAAGRMFATLNAPRELRQDTYNVQAEAVEAAAKMQQMLLSQRGVVQPVIDAVRENRPALMFWDAPAGTGKTFCANALLAAVRGMGKHAIAVASSGIAAVLLKGGRTFHSRFKAPLSMNKHSNPFNVPRQSTLAGLIRRAALIIWDEAPMMNRHYLEGLDAMLRDVMGNELPFGGKSVVIGGDFRQCLPVVVRGGRAQTVAASLKKSTLWHKFTTARLTVNMRVKQMGESPEAEAFASRLLDYGNGDGSAGEDVDGHRVVDIPEEMCVSKESTLIDFVFPGLRHGEVGDVVEGGILCTRNNIVDSINNQVAALFPGDDEWVANSADALAEEDAHVAIPVEYLNKQTPTGLPPHQLKLKPGMPVMLLRNLDPFEKLCNGTRLIVKKVMGNVLVATHVVDGEERTVMIPRIPLMPKDTDYPFKWTRRQFPVRLAFAMTINKSQGQTFRGRVGVLLPEPVFGHGQLYVASSRVVHPDNIRFCILHEAPRMVERTQVEAARVQEQDEHDIMMEMERREEENELYAMDYEEELRAMHGDDGDDDDVFDADEEAMMRAEEERGEHQEERVRLRDVEVEVVDDDAWHLSMEADYMQYSLQEGPGEDEEEILRQMEEEVIDANPPPPPRAPAPAPGAAPAAPAPGAAPARAPPRVVVRTRTRNVVYAEALA